ncbi:hypothetical protein T4C_13739 [Trichinella pseudospiralis]|uniref:Uncharacterized protein n=1 Tax=Trichinella pseudospiralis TaxID=6337 RepID=A0A0V1IVG2_TRIPS|nr:hypothetical protein T4E_2769 [Trichinella pseudospiralis]KRZ26678.1 hypothetical protein T4C_13739 [Trichinella pseudospiralis]
MHKRIAALTAEYNGSLESSVETMCDIRLLVFITVVGATRLRPDCQTKLTPRVSYEKGYSPLRSRTNDSVSLLET